jgi:hypothetical protein
MENQQTDPISALMSDFNTRLNEIEEKQRLIKDRTLLIGENLISTKEEFIQQNKEMNKQLKQITSDLETFKKLVNRIAEETNNFAKKSEFSILEHQAKIFQPLEFARIQDITKIVQEEIEKNLKKKTSENQNKSIKKINT